MSGKNTCAVGLSRALRLAAAKRILRRRKINMSKSALTAEIERFGLGEGVDLISSENRYRQIVLNGTSWRIRTGLMGAAIKFISQGVFSEYVLHNYRRAESQYINALSIHRVFKWNRNIAKDYIRLALLYKRQGRIDQAKRLLDDSAKLIKRASLSSGASRAP